MWKVEVGHYIRPIETISVADGIETKSKNESYDPNTGLVRETSVRRSNSFVAGNYLKYWWEVYDNGTTPRSLHLLTPVVQTRKTYNGQTIEASATRWKNWTCTGCVSGTAPGPLDSYVWKRNGTGEFAAWDEVNPVASGEWKFVNAVKVDGNGRTSESTDISGVSNASLWHSTLPRLLANVTNATLDQVLYESFEDCVSGCSAEAKTGSKSSQAAYNVVLPSAGTYTLTYWSKNAADWTLNVSTISSNTTIGGSGTIIDEVRLHPPGARLITYTYDEHGNVTTVCDENNRIAYTEYDEFNRVKLVRDTERNIMEHHSYNFKVE